ncbi:MAG: DUF1214 domain-containing protein, partial [Rhizorhabdus sp.]
MTNAMDWPAYHNALGAIRERLLALPAGQGAEGRAAVDRLLMEASASAYNLVMAPDPARPQLLCDTVFSPGGYDWMMPNPDFLYRYAFLDGRRRYRLTGQRGTSAFLDAQTIAGFFGDPDLKLLDSHRVEDMADTDGAIDIILSAARPEEGMHWIPLHPDRITTVILREAFGDWTAERGARLSLSLCDTVPVRRPGARDIGDRLAASIRMIDFCLSTFGPDFCQSVAERCGENAFVHVGTSRDEDASNPGVAYVPAAYRVQPDDALLLSFPMPHARYWSIHLTDRLSRTLDYAYRQTSLNNRQAHVTADGAVHIVLSARDPGIANWLDCGEDEEGMILLRWYGASGIVVPTIRCVPIGEIGELLPDDMVSLASGAR